MTAEEWRPVPGWPRYMVSSLGRVRGSQGRILTGDLGNRGHRRVRLSRGSEGRTVGVAVLVLEAFVGPRPPGMLALHERDDKSRNDLTSLRWGTRLDNAADARRNGRTPRGERHPKAKLCRCAVDDMRRRYAAGESAAALGAERGISRAAASAAIRGDTWSHVPRPLSREDTQALAAEVLRPFGAAVSS